MKFLNIILQYNSLLSRPQTSKIGSSLLTMLLLTLFCTSCQKEGIDTSSNNTPFKSNTEVTERGSIQNLSGVELQVVTHAKFVMQYLMPIINDPEVIAKIQAGLIDDPIVIAKLNSLGFSDWLNFAEVLSSISVNVSTEITLGNLTTEQYSRMIDSNHHDIFGTDNPDFPNPDFAPPCYEQFKVAMLAVIIATAEAAAFGPFASGFTATTGTLLAYVGFKKCVEGTYN